MPTTTLDIVGSVLSLAPVPYLNVAFNVFRFIWDSVQQTIDSHDQLGTLAEEIADLLRTLNQEYRAGRLLEIQTSGPLRDLTSLLNEILTFVKKHSKHGFLKSFYVRDDRIVKINSFHQRLVISVHSFQVSALVRIQDWQRKNDLARVSDQQNLHNKLNDLERNQDQLLRTLDVNNNNLVAMIISLRQHLERQPVQDRETQFLSRSIEHLMAVSGRQVQVESWMITSFDVEFEDKIGSGGFGTIYRAKWNGTQVAVKVLKSDGVAPRSALIHNEIKVWSKLLHPHILQFLGANIMDDYPFLVMPYLSKGNARDFVLGHPQCNRVKLLHDITLGLCYLHSQNVTHGDLKAMNVLIDDGDRALLCDFGLSSIKIDINSRTRNGDANFVIGSRFWMSPERLAGQSLRQPSDIYAFGMTIFEIYTNTTPLGEIAYVNFFTLVVTQGVRPQRPQYIQDSESSDEIWNLAEQCWAADPNNRPTADSIRDMLNQTLSQMSIVGRTVDQIHPLDPAQMPQLQQDDPANPIHDLHQAMEQAQAAQRRAEENDLEIRELRQKNLSMAKLLEGQSRELEVARQFITTTDSVTEADIINMVERLNGELFQCAADVADKLHQTTLRKPTTEPVENHVAYSFVMETGDAIAELLSVVCNAEDPTMSLQIALQACLVNSCVYMINSWHCDERFDDAFKDLYIELRDRVAPAVAGRWRALTKSCLDEIRNSVEPFAFEVTEYMFARISLIVTATGFQNVPLTFRTDLMGKLEEISMTVMELRRAIGEKITSCDIEVFLIPGGTFFDGTYMEDDFKTGAGLVLCTTGLGLRRSEDVTRERGTEFVDELMLAPKVVLQSVLADMIGASS